jgi:hypothetical protein
VFEIEAVFPDGSSSNSHNGGVNTRRGFKEVTLDQMMTECDGREAALVARPTQSILRDFQGNNLMLAFPLQFPFGIGAQKADGEYRGGPSYYRHLTYLSSISFQNAAFGAVIHNMAARQKRCRHLTFITATRKQSCLLASATKISN